MATVQDTGLPDAGVSAAVSVDAIHFTPDLNAAAEELLRVVEPGGVLAVTTWLCREGPERLTRDSAAALRHAGWADVEAQDQPAWLTAQKNLYREAAELADGEGDDAVTRVAREGAVLLPFLRGARRLLITARRP